MLLLQMAESDIAMFEFGFCLCKNEAIEEPKLLPCTHVHCSACLTGSYETNGVLQCPPPLLPRECRSAHQLGCAALLIFRSNNYLKYLSQNRYNNSECLNH